METKEKEWTSWWRGSRPCWLMYTSWKLNRRVSRARRRKSYRIFWWNCGIKSMRAGIHARRGIRLVWLGVWWAGRKLRRYWRIRWVSPCHPEEPDYKILINIAKRLIKHQFYSYFFMCFLTTYKYFRCPSAYPVLVAVVYLTYPVLSSSFFHLYSATSRGSILT